MSLADGRVFFDVKLTREDGEFFQVNFLRGLINSALFRTYGESFANWWSDGALTNMALIMMKSNNLKTGEVKKLIDLAKGEISLYSLYSKEKLKEILTYKQASLLFNSAIVDEIETYCPNHVIKINKTVQGIKKGHFTTEKQFNNYLIYIIKKECNIDISNILDKYYIEHDNVGKVIEQLVALESKIKILPSELLSEEVKNKITEINNAEELIQNGQVTEAQAKINSANNVIEPITIKLENILPKYNNTKDSISQIPVIFYLPGGMMAQGEFNEAINLIKMEKFEKAEQKMNSAQFWISNSASITLTLVVLAILGIIGVIFLTNKQLLTKFLGIKK